MEHKDQKPKLPTHSLAVLLRIAVADGRALDRSRYVPFYGSWHRGTEAMPNTRCRVCLAGGVLAGTVGLSPEKSVTDIYRMRDVSALYALDHARTGDYTRAYASLGHFDRARAVERATLRYPSAALFDGWPEFDEHLHSLEACIEPLEKFEAEVSAGGTVQ